MLSLKNMRPWEEVKIVIRRHYIIYWILWMYFLLWIWIILSFYLIFGFTIFSNLLVICFWLFYSIFLYMEWLSHELDLFIVTNNRIIWVEQISFLDRKVSECNLWQVQEVNSSTSWFFANMLNYWSIYIQTAGTVNTLRMDLAPDSLQWARKILNQVDDYRDRKQHNIEEPKKVEAIENSEKIVSDM